MAIRAIRRSAAVAHPLRSRFLPPTSSFLHTSPSLLSDDQNSSAWREKQSSKPLNPHMTNTNSTIANEMPSVGADKAPPELLTSVEPDFAPRDAVPENTTRMTGDTQHHPASTSTTDPNATPADLEVGELQGASFKVQPLRRTGEDAKTMRARLTYQSRKRGTLESELLLSTFADAQLGNMSPEQMQQYDRFLDENDWDIYYWATQPSDRPSGEDQSVKRDLDSGGSGTAPEWPNTAGTFQPAYRPVPARWKDSDVLRILRQHVLDRSAGMPPHKAEVAGEGLARGVKSDGGGGLGSMPNLKSYTS